jgi:hypothetical protein
MGQKKENILFRLKQIDKVLNALEEISPTPLTPDFLAFKEAKHKLVTNAFTKIDEQLLPLETLLYELVCKQLTELANHYDLPNHFKHLAENFPLDNNPAEQALKLIQSFKTQSSENYQADLKKSQLHTDNSAIASVSRKKTKKARLVAIENTPVRASHEADWQEIELFLKDLEAVKKVSTEFNLMAPKIDSSVANDCILQSLYLQFQKKTQSTQKLSDEITKKVQFWRKEVGYYPTLLEQLQKGIDDLKRLNEERKVLCTSLNERQELLLPQGNLSDLQNCFQQASQKLQYRLETFLHYFSTINLANRTGAEASFFKTQLLFWIEELYKDLRAKHFPVVKTVTDELRNNLLRHLGEKTSFFDIRPVTQALESDQINAVMQGLFTMPESADPVILKKQIAAMYHVEARLSCSPLTVIKQHDTLMTVATEQDRGIQKKQAELSERLNIMGTALREYLNLFSEASEPLIVKSRKLQSQLQTLLYTLQEFRENYTNNEKKDREQFELLLNQLRDKKTTQLDVLGMTQIIDVLNALTSREEEDLKQIQKFTEHFESLSIKARKKIVVLNQEYHYRKSVIHNEIQSALENARAAVSVNNPVPTEEEQQILKKYDSLLTHINDFEEQQTLDVDCLSENRSSTIEELQQWVVNATMSIKRLIDGQLRDLNNNLGLIKLTELDKQTPLDLGCLNVKKSSAIEELQQLITNAKISIKRSIDDNLRTLTNSLSLLKPSQLDRRNPFKIDLEHQIGSARTAIEHMNQKYNALESLSGKDMSAWYEELQNLYTKAFLLLEKSNHDFEQADIIEQRLRAEAFRTSLVVLDILEKEFLRIFYRYLKKAQHAYPSDMSLRHVKATIDDSINLNLGKEVLSKIDPRLSVLLEMYKEFYKINKRYISRNIRFYNDQSYFEALLKNVEKHLHNDHMEAISEGKRYLFVQWIRIHIFKSLQTLTHCVTNYFTDTDFNRHRFFVTWGACKTERKLVDKGNDVYSTLHALAPPEA